MTFTTALIAAPVVLAVGAFIFWANPARIVNRTVFLGSLQISVWLACWHLTVASRANPDAALFWLRWTNATGALTPLGLWIVNESILGNLSGSVLAWLRRRWLWIALPVAVALVPFTEWFIPAESTALRQIRGGGYYVYMVAEIAFYASLLILAIKGSWTLIGAQRLELQVWLGGGCSMCVAAWTLSALSTWTGNPVYRRLMPLMVLAFYAGAAVAVTIGRIFDARQLLLVVVQRSVLLAVVLAGAYALEALLVTVLPAPVPLLITAASILFIAFPLNSWLNRRFRFYPQAPAARRAAFDVAARETRPDRLVAEFLAVLKGWGQTETALILSGGRSPLKGGVVELSDADPALTALRALRWATPERLSRQRSTADRVALARFLQQQGLGVAVWAEGQAVSALVGVGMPTTRLPYTFPQLAQLRELASIMQGALERSHFSTKAQHAEQLATVGLLGASLAHEIRNPLVTIKTFVQLLPRHHQDPIFREKFFNLIGEEVTRIDRLTVELMDLATPRTYQSIPFSLHAELDATLDLVRRKATDKQITIRSEFEASPDRIVSDPSAVRQVLLNLAFNAIQAVERQRGERWVKVATRGVPEGVEMIVEDSGPGIAPGIRPRLFQPFQSTKSSGFGLGLAICSSILVQLRASISADPFEAGRGATFRIVFPVGDSTGE